MKRGADNYITRDDAEEDREGGGGAVTSTKQTPRTDLLPFFFQEAVPTEGFRKADDTVLAARRYGLLSGHL